MDKNVYINEIVAKFEQTGFMLQNDVIDSFDVTVATKSQFKLSWFATQINFFAIMGVSNNITKEIIENFSEKCTDYAIKNKKGLPRGFQSGTVSFTLLASLSVDEDAKKFAQERPKKHFAAFEMPVVFDLEENKLYYYDKTPTLGFIYYKTFRNFIKTYFK